MYVLAANLESTAHADSSSIPLTHSVNSCKAITSYFPRMSQYLTLQPPVPTCVPPAEARQELPEHVARSQSSHINEYSSMNGIYPLDEKTIDCQYDLSKVLLHH